MCISPRLKLNPKYLSNAKNGGVPPPLIDDRVKYVPIGCGVCYECLKQKSNQWKVRLYEEVKDETDWSFVTFTFNDNSLNLIREKLSAAFFKELEKNVDISTGEVIGKVQDIEKITNDDSICDTVNTPEPPVVKFIVTPAKDSLNVSATLYVFPDT